MPNWALENFMKSKKSAHNIYKTTGCKSEFFVKPLSGKTTNLNTLQGTNISPEKSNLKMIFLFPRVGYVSSLEGINNSLKRLQLLVQVFVESNDLTKNTTQLVVKFVAHCQPWQPRDGCQKMISNCQYRIKKQPMELRLPTFQPAWKAPKEIQKKNAKKRLF